MILVASPSKPFTFTAKLTPRRSSVIKHYEPEINALYDAVTESAQTDITRPEDWNLVNTTQFIKAVVIKMMGKSIRDDDNIFQHGADRYGTS